MYNTISAKDLYSKMKSEKVNLIDIRETYEHTSGHAKDSKNIPMNEVIHNVNKHLNKDETYYLICQSGGRSSMAVQYLASQGYKVIDVVGGHNVWPGDLVR